MTSPSTGDDTRIRQGRVAVMRTALAWLAAVLLVGGCGSGTAGTAVAAPDPALIEACEDFSDAYNAYMEVIRAHGPKKDYDAAHAQMGDALERGRDASTGDLAQWFPLAFRGWEADKAAGGDLPEDENTALFIAYGRVIDGCAAIGADATRPPE